MKIKYIGKAYFASGGLTLAPGQELEIAAEKGKYLVDTFKGKFIEVAAPKPEPKPEPKKTTKRAPKPEAEDK